MKRLGSFDAQPFAEMANGMRMMKADWQRFMLRFAAQIGEYALKRLVERTPSSGTGGLREAWSVESVELTAAGARVALHNAMEYASYVNDGFKAHFVPGHWEGNEFVYHPDDPEGGMFVGGRKGDFVPGRHMVELSLQDLEQVLPQAMKMELAAWAKGLGLDVTP